MADLSELDRACTAALRLQPDQPLWTAAVLLAHSGDSWLCLGWTGLIWLFSRGEWHAKAGLMALAVCAQALLIFGVKQVIRRERPAGEWGGIYRAIDPHSFPSGHATRAALLAALAAGLGPFWFALLLAAWAPLVALARVATGVHYFSDVLAGAVIGILFGLLTLWLHPALQTWLPALFDAGVMPRFW